MFVKAVLKFDIFLFKMDCEADKTFANSQCSGREQTTCCDLTKLLPHMPQILTDISEESRAMIPFKIGILFEVSNTITI